MRLELKDITKRFPGVLANDRISISVDPPRSGQVVYRWPTEVAW